MAVFPQPLLTFRAVSASATANPNDNLLVTTGASTIPITLPPVAGNPGCPVSVRKVDSGTGAVKLVTADGSTIDGVAGATGITTAATQHVGYEVVNDGANWWVTGQ